MILFCSYIQSESHLQFVVFLCKQLDPSVSTMSQLKSLTLPGFVPPVKVIIRLIIILLLLYSINIYVNPYALTCSFTVKKGCISFSIFHHQHLPCSLESVKLHRPSTNILFLQTVVLQGIRISNQSLNSTASYLHIINIILLFFSEMYMRQKGGMMILDSLPQ